MSEKKLSDFIHLYLGSRCMWRVLDDRVWKECGIDLKVLDRLYDRQPFDVKPILRHIRNLTADEVKYIFNNIDSDEDFMDVNVNRGTYHLLINFNPFTIAYLLKCGIDLFGLIESGLAIDATTLK